MFARLFENMLPETALKGILEYSLFPSRRRSWGGPFNGQAGRLQLVNWLMELAPPALIIETGTFRGTTTVHLALQGAPVVSIEARSRNLGFARRQLMGFNHVDLRLGDSRKNLRRMLAARTPFHGPEAVVFAYLDAHWYDDLPLADEIEIIFAATANAIVMIDDFQVPGDAGYAYDDYGPGRALIGSYVAPAVERFDLVALYPTLPSIRETGAKRGCVVLASRERWAETLIEGGLLRVG